MSRAVGGDDSGDTVRVGRDTVPCRMAGGAERGRDDGDVGEGERARQKESEREKENARERKREKQREREIERERRENERVVIHVRFNIGMDHSGEARNENASNSSVELEPFLSTFAGPETSNCPSNDPGGQRWFL